MKRTCIFALIGAAFLFLSLISIVSVITSPGYFSILFTIALLSMLASLAFWSGPRAYVHRMFEADNRTKTYVLFGSIIGALISSLVLGSYVLSLIFLLIELNAVLLYFCNTCPMGRAASTSFSDLQSQATNAAVKYQVGQMLK